MPKRRSKRSQRSAAEWGIRGAVALAAAMIGFVSVSGTLANVVAKFDPARAHLLAPHHGHITAAFAEQSLTLDTDGAAGAEASQLARLALRQDATAVSALSVLGLQAQLRDAAQQRSALTRARELFSYSHRLSRRELRTQIWVIEEAVNRGDISGALNQYDTALRTSRKARDVLFPVLAAAISEPAVRSRLLETILQGPAWGEAFVSYVAARAPEPQAAVQFFREGQHTDLPVGSRDRSRLLNALVAQGLTDEAWRYYETFRPGADRRRSRDAEFASTTDATTIFDWNTLNPQGLSASIQKGRNGGLLHFSATPGSGGTVLRQMQLLPAGNYRLEGRSSGIDQPEHSRPYWTLTCRDGLELGRIPLPNSVDEWESFTGRFTVPSGCPAQTLSLVIRASDSISGVVGQIDTAQLLPLR